MHVQFAGRVSLLVTEGGEGEGRRPGEWLLRRMWKRKRNLHPFRFQQVLPVLCMQCPGGVGEPPWSEISDFSDLRFFAFDNQHNLNLDSKRHFA